jgi:hypothetical protein
VEVADMTATRLPLPPSESARLAAAAPGEVVEVRCGTGPLPSGGSEVTVVNGGMYAGMLTWVEPYGPCMIRRYVEHPAPAVGAEVWVGPACEFCRRGTETHPATCHQDGQHEGSEAGYACDEACAHDQSFKDTSQFWDDGGCRPLDPPLRATVTALGAARYCETCESTAGPHYQCPACGCEGDGPPPERCPCNMAVRPPGWGCPANDDLGHSCDGAPHALDACPTCQGSPPWWATVSLRREP